MLNEKYFKLTTEEKRSQKDAYKFLMMEESYRFLNGYTYSSDPQPLRSGRIAVVPPGTEVTNNNNIII